MKIAFACNRACFQWKKKLMRYLRDNGHEIIDLGCYSAGSSDYPDYGPMLAERIGSGKSELGVTLCGSGNGITMTANKPKRIRFAICRNPEFARLAKTYNNANMIAIPARFVTADENTNIVNSFRGTDFEGGRHQRRIDKIPIIR